MEIFNFIFHIDEYLGNVLALFGNWTYLILFVVIFAETGLVVTPFLPGDSLLFAVGTLSGGGLLDIWTAYAVLFTAAVAGDTLNYWVGYCIGPKVFSKEKSRFFNKAYLEKTREFYKKYGGKAIILARFMPIVRTFAPFVAGIGKMHYNTFLSYNIIGAFLWVTSLTFIGYFFGGIPIIKENFEYAVVVIIILSLAPMILEYIKHKRGPKIFKDQLKHATYQDIQKTLKDEHLKD